MLLSKSHLVRIIRYTVIVIGLVVGSLLAYQILRGKLNASILTKVDSLVLYPPKDTSELQWAVLVYWTHNLHGSASPEVHASYSSLRKLEGFLDTAIANGPDRHSIDWLWERYAAMSDSGWGYSTKYKPIRDSIVEEIAAEGADYYDIRSYRDFMKGVQANSR
jgi:hypothetical protein